MFKFFSKSSVDPPNILKFYENHAPSEDFDDILYLKAHPEVQDFYKPFCLKHGISERKRLYYHFYFYGPKNSTSFSKYCLSERADSSSNLNFRHFKVGYCTTAYNRIESIEKTLPINLRRKKNDEQLVIVDYNSTDGLYDYIKENFHDFVRSGDIKYIFLKTLPYYNCPIAKNIAHYYCDAEYLVNLDSDNTLNGMRSAIDDVSAKYIDNFILHMAVLEKPMSTHMQCQKKGYAGTFGRICMHKNDFIKLAGYKETFLPMAYQDTDLISRARALGFNYINKPVKSKPIENPKFITFSSDSELYSWSDCRDINEAISNHSLDRNQLVAENIPKKIFAEFNFKKESFIEYSNIADYKPAFNIKKQINPNCGSNAVEALLDFSFSSYQDLLDFYLKNVLSNILFEKPEIIESIKLKLTKGITDFAINNSFVYRNLKSNPDQVFSRLDYGSTKDWRSLRVKDSEILNQHTSGSTTGKHFDYFNCKKYFSFVQDEAEFKIIRKEYLLPDENLKVLCLLEWPGKPKFDSFFLDTDNLHPGNMFNSFGASSFSTTFLNFANYQSELDLWHEKLFELLNGRFYDVVLSSGSVVNILRTYIEKFNFKHKFCHLLSNSTEPLRAEDFLWLKNRGNINHFCDHMRCWDGGVTFFTCEHGTYHLHEGLANVKSRKDQSLVSTCFTNIAAPFINYQNGDYADLSLDYSRCKCGRYYRPFKMIQHRPFAVKGVGSIQSIRDAVKSLSLEDSVSQIQFHQQNVLIFCKNSLCLERQSQLSQLLPKFNLIFKQ